MDNKQLQMEEWLKANPDKTKRDWLLEVRCSNDADRAAMSRLLDTLDKGGVKYGICVCMPNYYTDYQTAPLNEHKELYFDLMIAPDVGRNSYLIETDMLDNVLGQLTWNARRTESIPEEAFRWLLNKWDPDFDIDSLDKKQYHELMWPGMGGVICKVVGDRGFPDWRLRNFGEQVVATYRKDCKDTAINTLIN